MELVDHLSGLPLEILFETISWLPLPDLLHLESVSKHLRSVVLGMGQSYVRHKLLLPSCPSYLANSSELTHSYLFRLTNGFCSQRSLKIGRCFH